MPVKHLQEFLDSHHVKYVTLTHSPAYSAQMIAASTHTPGKEFAKAVMVKLDGKMAMAVLPACNLIDFHRLKAVAGSDAQNVAVLQAAHIDGVSLANNHTLDFADEALLEMLRILHGARIGHAGAGEDLAESSRAAITYVQGRRIGVIAFTDNEPGWEAEERKPGIFYVPIDVHDRRAKKLLEMIHTCKAVVDFLIVSAPWDPNWGYRPPGAHPPFARALLEAGADAIFGHSGHVFRGIELYQGKPIIYCAGNFIDDYAVDEVERNDQSWMFVLEIDGSQVQRLLLYPTVIRGFQRAWRPPARLKRWRPTCSGCAPSLSPRRSGRTKNAISRLRHRVAGHLARPGTWIAYRNGARRWPISTFRLAPLGS